MKKLLVTAVCMSLLAGLTLLPRAGADDAAPKRCGLTTLQGTIDFSVVEEGAVLKCGPGQKLIVRKKLAKPNPNRAKTRVPLLSFISIADVQLADEESPLRAEWADKCEDHPAEAAFRPQETMVPHLLAAHIRAANKIAERGGPILKDDFDFAVGLGDLADNQQLNEIRWIIDLFDGNKLVNPDSGEGADGDGYDGFQSVDPTGAAEPIETPVEGERILDLANEPFWAGGLRQDGKSLPWYTLPGNHDIKTQGTLTNSEAWYQFADQYAQGSIKWTDLPPDKQQEACSGGFQDPAFWMSLATNPGGARQVPADPNRHILTREEWVEEHFTTTGIPEGHGYDGNRCTDENRDPLFRACYSFTQGLFHFIGLDTNPDEGLENGNIDDPQFQWLERELVANSKSYFDVEGQKVTNKEGRNKLVVIFTHHTITSSDNQETQGAHDGAELKNLLLRFPNVILQSDGHTHQNRIWRRRNKDLGTGYWEVNTSAIADFPTQSRTVEIADNRDGTLSIFAVIFDALAPVDARPMDWVADDPTSEVDLGGAEVDINEEWLASFGREVLFYDPQGDLNRIGNKRQRNVELLIKAPFKIPR